MKLCKRSNKKIFSSSSVYLILSCTSVKPINVRPMQTNVFLKGVLLTDVLGWTSLQRFLLTSRTLLVECPEEVSAEQSLMALEPKLHKSSTTNVWRIPFLLNVWLGTWLRLQMFKPNGFLITNVQIGPVIKQRDVMAALLGATVQPSSQQKHLECVSRSCLMGYETSTYFT